MLGVDHRRAPLSVIEAVAVPAEGLRKALHEVHELEQVLETVIVSTCNRVEVYVDLARFHDGYDAVVRWLAERGDMSVEVLEESLVARVDEQAAAHLFAVAGGLDSMVVGEQQIAMQVRDAMIEARDEGTAGRMLLRLFRQAVRVGRRVRRETAITDGASSMVDVGLDAAAQRLGAALGDRRTLVVGAGVVGSLAADALVDRGAAEVAVWNRSHDKAERLAAKVGGRVVAPDALGPALTDADVVVCTTGAPEPVLTTSLLAQVEASRGGRPIVLLDLAVPRNVAPDAAGLPGVALLDVAAVREVADRGVTGTVLADARRVVDDEAEDFRQWLRQIAVEPTVRALRLRAEQVRTDELDRLASRLSSLDDDQRGAVEALTQGIVNTLLHTPTVRLKGLADAGAERHVAALVELFGLELDDATGGRPDVDRPPVPLGRDAVGRLSRGADIPAPLRGDRLGTTAGEVAPDVVHAPDGTDDGARPQGPRRGGE